MRSAMNIARNEKALTAKHGAMPTRAMIVPAAAGPMMREQCTTTLFNATAFKTRSEPTISTTKDCRAGLSKAKTVPRTKTSASTIHGSTSPLRVRPKSVSAGTISDSCVIVSSVRLDIRSASNPP